MSGGAAARIKGIRWERAVALHKLVVSQASDDGDAQHDADIRLWSDAIGVLEEDQ